MSAENMRLLRATRARGGRLIAVGTTATRVLETLAAEEELKDGGEPPASASVSGGAPRSLQDGVVGETEIFITPGYEFRAVDALLTNFHLPRSSVLALTMAFAGQDRLREAYEAAIALRYRFFSFGDAMLVEKRSKQDQTEEGPR